MGPLLVGHLLQKHSPLMQNLLAEVRHLPHPPSFWIGAEFSLSQMICIPALNFSTLMTTYLYSSKTSNTTPFLQHFYKLLGTNPYILQLTLSSFSEFRLGILGFPVPFCLLLYLPDVRVDHLQDTHRVFSPFLLGHREGLLHLTLHIHLQRLCT
jgi:hypothetical protein